MTQPCPLPGTRAGEPRLLVSFDEVVAGCAAIVAQARAAGCMFGAVLGIPNGGVVPARLVAEFLADPRATVAGTRQGSRRVPVSTAFPLDPPGPVLVVDAICDSGETMKL